MLERLSWSVPWVFDGRAWGHAQDLDLDDHASRIFSAVRGLRQTVHWAEFLGVILVLQALTPVHLRIDNENVCNNVAKIIEGWKGPLSASVRMVTCLPALLV